MSFPKNFLFCASSGAYQIEGAWNEDGKGESIWDRIAHTQPYFIKNRDNGDVACDSYRHYKKDIQLMKHIGFNVYRFSISWPRILPNGEITDINEAGIQYYHHVIDDLRRHGIQPLITIYHWDLPQKLQDIGGWMNPLIVDYIEDYADLLFERFGDKVKLWITINEPIMVIKGYESDDFAPGLRLGSPANYIVGHNLLRAHARIYRLYERKYRNKQGGKLSISLNSRCFKEKTGSEEDLEATKRAYIFNLDWLAYPIYSTEGDYPPLMKQIIKENSEKEGRKRSRLPSFTQDEIRDLKGSCDFFALNHYTTSLCSPGKPPYASTFFKDMNVTLEFDPSWPATNHPQMKVVPWGMRELLRYIKENYGNPEVFITENGYGNEDTLDDQDRIDYYTAYLSEVMKAIKDYGCNVIAYSAWSILDNLEWREGYGSRFGLIRVDFDDPERKRTLKSSASFFKKLIDTHSLPESGK